MLDQHSKETLDRSVERAVHHDRLLARAVFGHVLQAEARWQVEIELDGRELPQTPDGVDQLDVDLRTVEGGLAGNRLVGDLALFQNFL